MPILGTLIDRTTVSRAGDAGTTAQNIALTTLAHSLPATNPESMLVNLRSIQGVGAVARTPGVFALGGNASLSTIGYEYASGVSAGTIMFDVLAIVWHSVIK